MPHLTPPSERRMTALSSVLCSLRCIGYELLPVHPQYAYKQTKTFMRILKESSKIIGSKYLELIKATLKYSAGVKIRTWLQMLLWTLIWNLFILIEFGSLFIIISLFAAMFCNLGQREEGDLSAYSVFNKGYTTLLGQSTGQQFDKEIRHNFVDDDEEEVRIHRDDPKDPLPKGKSNY